MKYFSLLTFLDKCFKLRRYVCNGCNDLSMMSTNIDDIALLKINDVDFPCIINANSKIEVFLLKMLTLLKKTEHYKILSVYKNG